MIAYIHTSALIPLIIEEPRSQSAGRLWDTAEQITSVRLVYAEERAALAPAVRLGRITASELSDTIAALDDLYDQLALIEVDDGLVRRAGELGELHALRGYDAVHLAAAERVADETTVMVSGDRELLGSAGTLGLAVAASDTTFSPRPAAHCDHCPWRARCPAG